MNCKEGKSWLKPYPFVGHQDLQSQVAALENDGYTYLPRVINPAEIAELRSIMDRLEAMPGSYDQDDTPKMAGYSTNI